MFRDSIITRYIILTPKELCNLDMNGYLFEKLREKFLNMCSEDGTMIVKIKNIDKMSNLISKDGKSIVFTISFTVTLLKLELEETSNFTPIIVNPDGVIGNFSYENEVYTNIMFFIPSSKLKSCNLVIDLKTEVKATICSFRYEPLKIYKNKSTGGISYICKISF